MRRLNLSKVGNLSVSGSDGLAMLGEEIRIMVLLF